MSDTVLVTEDMCAPSREPGLSIREDREAEGLPHTALGHSGSLELLLPLEQPWEGQGSKKTLMHPPAASRAANPRSCRDSGIAPPRSRRFCAAAPTSSPRCVHQHLGLWAQCLAPGLSRQMHLPTSPPIFPPVTQSQARRPSPGHSQG